MTIMNAIGNIQLDVTNNLSDVPNKPLALSNLGGIGASTTNTLTNKSMDGAFNTFTNLPASAITGIVPVVNGGTGNNNRTLTDSSLVLSANWGTRLFYNSLGRVSLNYNNYILYDAQATPIPSVTWNTRILTDAGFVNSLAWNLRNLIDSANKLSIDWDARQLYANDGSTVDFDWSSPSGISLNLPGILMKNTNFYITDTVPTSQGANSLAFGVQSGITSQGDYSISIGHNAGNANQGIDSVAIGNASGQTSQSSYSVSIGGSAGTSSQGSGAVAIGYEAGYTSQGLDCVALGNNAGNANQLGGAVAIGYQSGQTGQSGNAISIGNTSGNSNQGTNAVAIGYQAGQTSQGANSVCLGTGAVATGSNSVAIGNVATTVAFTSSIALGPSATTTASNQAILPNGVFWSLDQINDLSNIESISINNRQLFANDGTTLKMDWSDPNQTIFTSIQGTEFAVVPGAAPVVNYIQVNGAPTGNSPIFTSVGTDANVDMTFMTQGTGDIDFTTGSGSLLLLQSNASAVNYFVMENAATGNAINLYAFGADSNVNMNINGRGTGLAYVNGVAISGTPSANYLPIATTSTTATWQANPLATADNEIYVHWSKGSDVTGNGSEWYPYKTLGYALTQITANSPTTPYIVYMSADIYTETTISLKPYVAIKGAGYFATIINASNPIVLDATWSGVSGSTITISGINTNASTWNLDFNAVGAGGNEIDFVQFYQPTGDISITGTTGAPSLITFFESQMYVANLTFTNVNLFYSNSYTEGYASFTNAATGGTNVSSYFIAGQNLNTLVSSSDMTSNNTCQYVAMDIPGIAASGAGTNIICDAISYKAPALSGGATINPMAIGTKGISVQEGSNGKQGVATLVAGTVTVANTSITANSRIIYSVSTAGGVQGFLSTTQIAATSFTFNSTSVADTSTIVYEIFEPA